MPTRVADSPGTIANDLAMLLLTGGRERTEQEYRCLLHVAAGFQLTRIVPIETRSMRKENWVILESNPA